MARTRERDAKPAGPKPRNDAYVVMLAVTLFALLVGTVLMYLDHDEYGKNPPPKEAIPVQPRLGESIKGADGGAADPKADPGGM